MGYLLRLLIVAGLLCALAPQSVRAQTPEPSGYTVGACASVQPEQLRAEIESAAAAAITSSEAVDIEALVARKWAELDVDSAIDTAVAAATARVQADEGYWSRLLSGWSAGRAEEFAERVAADAFSSDLFNDKIEELSLAIGEEVARAVNAQLAGAASVAFLCLRDYVGEAYTNTLFTVFENTVSQTVAAAGVEFDASDLGVNALDTHAMGLAGAGIVVAVEVGRRVSVKLSEKVAQRVAGKVVGRVAGRAGASIIPAIGWIVGVGLIIYDLVEGGRGALPQIEEALTSVEVKDRIRADVVDAVRVGLPEETAIAALETAVTMIEKWDAFCSTYADVCELADDNPSFAHLLNDADVVDVVRLEQYVDLFLATFGRERLNSAIETGSFDQLVALPQVALQVLRETGSVETTLQWAALAGNERLHDVAALGIHTLASPQTLDAATLDQLVGTADVGLVQQLLLLDSATMTGLLALPPAVMRSLLAALSPAEVARFVQAQRLPAITATPPALVAQAVISGLVTLAELEATPAPPALATAPGVAQAATVAAPLAAATATFVSDGTPVLSAGAVAGQRASPGTLALLAGLVVALFALAGGIWFVMRRRPAPPSP
ncbi:MAG: hypothetical protein ACRC1H_15415 [Caldilineaceae bacterium]